MSTTKTNRTSLLDGDQKMIDAVQKHLSKVASLSVGSQTVTPSDIVKVFQDRLTVGKATVTAEAARTAAVKAYRDKRAQTATFVSSFKRMIQGMYSQSPDILAEFGLKAPKAGKKTVAVKATALAKNEATRKARNTMGAKQKLGVTGDVVDTVITPVTSAQPPVAPQGPAAPPPAGGATGPAPHGP